MQNQQPKMDEETLAFLQQVFQLVRGGRAEEFREYLVRGLPPNLRNASTFAQSTYFAFSPRLPPPPSRVTSRSSVSCSTAAPMWTGAWTAAGPR